MTALDKLLLGLGAPLSEVPIEKYDPISYGAYGQLYAQISNVLWIKLLNELLDAERKKVKPDWVEMKTLYQQIIDCKALT